MNACMKGVWFKFNTNSEKESMSECSGKDYWLRERGGTN